jgi:hypothetical protein
LNQHATDAALTDPLLGRGLQDVAVEFQREENHPGKATRACDQAAIAMCARPSSAGRSSIKVFDPETGQTVTIEPTPRALACGAALFRQTCAIVVY